MRTTLLGLTMLTALASVPARAQMDSREAIALQNQILELRRDMQNQRGGSSGGDSYSRPPPSRGGGGGGADPALTAQLLDRVATLEDQNRDLRGQLDRLSNQVTRQAAEQNKQIADLAFTVQNGAGRTAAAAPAAVAAPPPSSNLASVPAGNPGGSVPRTPELAMQEGNAALARRDYPAAEAAAREVLAKKGPRSGDAQFLLAQSELGQRNYQQAAPDFYDAYNRNRTGSRAPDALLGVANALIGIGDKQSACEALGKLRTEFPRPRQDVADGETAARGRAGCR